MPHVDANGQSLYYEVHGEGEPLLLVMGLASDHLSWALQTPAFAERFQTIVFDNRDVGQSSYAEEPYQVKDMAADALALADALELDTFHLLGMSMGGAIAQEMALAAPERIRTLTLVATFGGSGRYAREKTRLWALSAMRTPPEEQVEELLLLCLTEQFYENEEAVAFAKQMVMSNPNPQRPEGFMRQVVASGNHEARDRVGSLSMPVHVIGADHDILVPVWKSKELAELIPGAELTVMEGAAHGVNLEFAEQFNAAVLEWLRARAGDRAAA